jgi:hypothetical protein
MDDGESTGTGLAMRDARVLGREGGAEVAGGESHRSEI